MADQQHYTTKAEANRANAQRSTGPRTEEGKRIASHNALRTGLTGRTVLLPTDDLHLYAEHLQRLHTCYHPQTDEETLLVETITHIEWRLLRIPTLETSILAVGREDCADLYPDHPYEVRVSMIDAKVHLTYGKQLANLGLQETRLNRQHEREVAKLQALIQAREDAKKPLLQEAVAFYAHLQAGGKPFPYGHIRSLGFEFSTDDLKRALAHEIARRTHPHWPTFAAQEIFEEKQFNIETNAAA